MPTRPREALYGHCFMPALSGPAQALGRGNAERAEMAPVMRTHPLAGRGAARSSEAQRVIAG